MYVGHTYLKFKTFNNPGFPVSKFDLSKLREFDCNVLSSTFWYEFQLSIIEDPYLNIPTQVHVSDVLIFLNLFCWTFWDSIPGIWHLVNCMLHSAKHVFGQPSHGMQHCTVNEVQYGRVAKQWWINTRVTSTTCKWGFYVNWSKALLVHKCKMHFTRHAP